jgi:hypothetical protein
MYCNWLIASFIPLNVTDSGLNRSMHVDFKKLLCILSAQMESLRLPGPQYLYMYRTFVHFDRLK